MRSGWLLLFGCVLLVLAGQSRRAPVSGIGSGEQASIQIAERQEYAVEETLVLRNEGPGEPEKQSVWVALIRDFPPYQEVAAQEIAPLEYRPVTDEYGNGYAEFDFSDQPVGTTRTVSIKTDVVVNRLQYDLMDCRGKLLDEYIQPELHIESANPQIVDLARSLAAGTTTICQRVWAFYNYTADHLAYTYNERNWGAQATLGPMGADCTEYASLLVALSRSQGIPARYFEGLRYVAAGSQNAENPQHAWADVYLPGIGWTAMDPTLGRPGLYREDYFAHYTPDHIVVTMGVNPSTLRGSSYWTPVLAWERSQHQCAISHLEDKSRGGWRLKAPAARSGMCRWLPALPQANGSSERRFTAARRESARY
jgi:transglutaminase-like putative cysteine protease